MNKHIVLTITMLFSAQQVLALSFFKNPTFEDAIKTNSLFIGYLAQWFETNKVRQNSYDNWCNSLNPEYEIKHPNHENLFDQSVKEQERLSQIKDTTNKTFLLKGASYLGLAAVCGYFYHTGINQNNTYPIAACAAFAGLGINNLKNGWFYQNHLQKKIKQQQEICNLLPLLLK